MKLSILIILIHSVHSYESSGHVFYCPVENSSPYCKSDIKLYVNVLNSVESLIPYEYHSFDFCTPQNGWENLPKLNFGQLVFGDRIRTSNYNITFGKPVTCETVCERSYDKKNPDDQRKLDFLRKGIQQNYQQHWIVDNMPVTWCYEVEGSNGQLYCSPGFPIGCYVTPNHVKKDACTMQTEFNKADTTYVFNHVSLKVIYYKPDRSSLHDVVPEQAVELVSVRATPLSIKHEKGKRSVCDPTDVLGIDAGETDAYIRYTYSVEFEENKDVRWSSRWDYILESMPNPSIQWFSLLNSVVVLLFLTGLLAMIISRIVRRDICRYSKLGEAQEGKHMELRDSWKMLHGDMLRPPGRTKLLPLFLGSGVQLFFTCVITLVVANLGVLSPANRGALVKCVIYTYVCLAPLAGYTTARLYKTFGGEERKTMYVLSPIFCPAVAFNLFVIMSSLMMREDSSAVDPRYSLTILVTIWVGIALPLNCLGVYFGFKKQVIEHPVSVSQSPQPIPPQRFSVKRVLAMLAGGILPFGCMFIQLFFILNSIWFHQLYYMFGFLLLTFIVLIIECVEITIIWCYYRLRAQDYNWWWGSFLTGGSVAFYFVGYCVYYFVSKLTLTGFTNTFIYFGYTFIMAYVLFLATGTIGFFACFWFVRKIYSRRQMVDIYIVDSTCSSPKEKSDIFTGPVVTAYTDPK